MKAKIKPFFVWSLVLLLSACNLSADLSGEDAALARAWFDAPLPGTVFAPPNPCNIVAHGASPNGIVLFELSINGSSTSIPSPDTNSSLVTLSQDCGLSEPGDYLLEMRVQDNAGNWSNFAQTNIVISDDDDFIPASEISESETSTPAPESTATSTPASTATPAGTASVSIESISTNTVYIGGTSCGTREVVFTVRASHPQGLKVIVLFYRFQAGSTSEWQSVSMNSAGGDLYQQTVNVGGLFGNSIPFDQGTMQYQAVLQTDSGDTSTRTPVFGDIAVLACGSAPACSSYLDQTSCEANGCSWKLAPGIVPLFSCQNP
ncbi:MAG: hypothetical protein QY332_21260 [Anaerolineales bacterium]|nr:MAG: hypothetical protein QY332_21260 [Anaerolineales bacterium]